MSSQRLSGEEVDAIAQYGARATWPSGFQIYQRATSADGVFVLVQGRVALRSKVKSGRAFAAALVSPGETFGAEGLAPNGTYTTDARAEEECETLFLSGIRFRSFVREQPQQALALLGQIMVERTELLERLHEIATLSVEQRMLASIVWPQRVPSSVRTASSRSIRHNTGCCASWSVQPERACRWLPVASSARASRSAMVRSSSSRPRMRLAQAGTGTYPSDPSSSRGIPRAE
jgi:CRP-like cAMP-binding protein